jgi:hypothetical protein
MVVKEQQSVGNERLIKFLHFSHIVPISQASMKACAVEINQNAFCG